MKQLMTPIVKQYGATTAIKSLFMLGKFSDDSGAVTTPGDIIENKPRRHSTSVVNIHISSSETMSKIGDIDPDICHYFTPPSDDEDTYREDHNQYVSKANLNTEPYRVNDTEETSTKRKILNRFNVTRVVSNDIKSSQESLADNTPMITPLPSSSDSSIEELIDVVISDVEQMAASERPSNIPGIRVNDCFVKMDVDSEYEDEYTRTVYRKNSDNALDELESRFYSLKYVDYNNNALGSVKTSGKENGAYSSATSTSDTVTPSSSLGTFANKNVQSANASKTSVEKGKPSLSTRSDFHLDMQREMLLMKEHGKLRFCQMEKQAAVEKAYSRGRQDALADLRSTLVYYERLTNELQSERLTREDYVESRETEAFELIDRLQQEIVNLRKRNTKLLDNASSHGKVGRSINKEMLDLKNASNKELIINIGLRNKINEMKMLILRQQRHLTDLEMEKEKLKQLVAAMRQRLGESNNEQDCDECMETCQLSHVIFCDRAKYVPHLSDDPSLAATDVFNIGGRRTLNDLFTPAIRIFNPMDIPYVRKQLLDDYQHDYTWSFETPELFKQEETPTGSS